ncbi:Type I restriction-modification system,restriction subunit R [Rhodococcus aetherivorans]|nr:Type I restriction-modification system,restriction subunit R [Rhodococcus aetherivorans]
MFGDYIDVYDLTRAVEDGATVPVHFESRLVKVAFAGDVTEEQIDASADELTVGLDDTDRDRIEKSVAVVNAVYGAPARLHKLAADLVEHWESRREQMAKFVGSDDNPTAPGKALIVCATREICANLYDEIVALRPDWHSGEISSGRIKVVYSGTAADQPPIDRHVRRDSANAAIKKRLKDIDDELEIVIVKDMLLTGFDAPPLHTLYLDRPLKGALLMQALARVNRTFRGKRDGLLVAYAPVADNLAEALAEYTATDQETKPLGRPIEESFDAVKNMLTVLVNMLHGFDWRSRLRSATGPRGYIEAVLATVNYLRDPKLPENRVPEGTRPWRPASGNSPPNCPAPGRSAALIPIWEGWPPTRSSSRKSASTWRSSTPRIGRRGGSLFRRTCGVPCVSSWPPRSNPARYSTSTTPPAFRDRRSPNSMRNSWHGPNMRRTRTSRSRRSASLSTRKRERLHGTIWYVSERSHNVCRN